jgi:short-subunit dehydrogenase
MRPARATHPHLPPEHHTMEYRPNRYALVTGASSGIGLELAKVLAAHGHDLVIVARRPDALHALASELAATYEVKVVPLARDLFEPRAAHEIHEEVHDKGIVVDILVNDAGQGVYGRFAETPLERQLAIIQLNVVALTTLTWLFLRDMVLRDEGRILQLGSIVSELPAPLQAVYGGTKAYVLSFTEALISELRDQGSAVTVTTLQPGVTDTDFFNKAGAERSKLVADRGRMADPAKVARDGYAALMRGDDKVVSGVKNKVQVAVANVLPERVVADGMHRQSAEVPPEHEGAGGC